jgi:hypothetical protein
VGELVDRRQRELAEHDGELDDDERRGEEDVARTRSEHRLGDRDRNGGDDHGEIGAERHRREQRAAKALPAHGRSIAGHRLVLAADELQLVEDGDESVDVHLLAVRRLVPALGVGQRSTGAELAHQRRAVGREHAIGIDVAPADHHLVAVRNERQTMQPQHGRGERMRHDPSPPRSARTEGSERDGALQMMIRDQSALTQQQQP